MNHTHTPHTHTVSALYPLSGLLSFKPRLNNQTHPWICLNIHMPMSPIWNSLRNMCKNTHTLFAHAFLKWQHGVMTHTRTQKHKPRPLVALPSALPMPSRRRACLPSKLFFGKEVDQLVLLQFGRFPLTDSTVSDPFCLSCFLRSNVFLPRTRWVKKCKFACFKQNIMFTIHSDALWLWNSFRGSKTAKKKKKSGSF